MPVSYTHLDVYKRQREGRVPETLGEHTRILEAMRGGDWKLAVEAVNVHMARPQELIMIEVEKKNS